GPLAVPGVLAAKAREARAVFEKQIDRRRIAPAMPQQMPNEAGKNVPSTHVEVWRAEDARGEFAQRLRAVARIPVGDATSVKVAQPQVGQQLARARRVPEQL